MKWTVIQYLRLKNSRFTILIFLRNYYVLLHNNKGSWGDVKSKVINKKRNINEIIFKWRLRSKSALEWIKYRLSREQKIMLYKEVVKYLSVKLSITYTLSSCKEKKMLIF